MEVALYYRDNHDVKWRHLASSNISRILDCQLTSYVSKPLTHATGIFCLLALSVERHHHLHTLMCSVSTFTVVFIHTMEDDQRLNTLVHKGDALHFMLQQ